MTTQPPPPPPGHTPPPGYTPPPGHVPPPAQSPYGQGPPRGTGGEAFFAGIRGWGVVRTQDRWAGGVAGGLALRLGVDPLITRGLFAASVLLGGLGLLLYGIAWALLPEQRDGRIHLQELFQGRFTAGFLGSVVVLLIGLSSLPDRWLPGWYGPEGSGSWWFGLAWLAAAAVVVALVVQSRQGSGAGRPPSTSFPARPAAPGGPDAPDGPGTPGGYAGPAGPGAPTDPGVDATPPPPPAGASSGYAGPSGYAGYSGYSGYSGHSTAPATAYRPSSVPLQPVQPVRPRPQGPGAAAVGVVTALTLLTLAGLLLAERTGDYAGPVLLTAGAVGVVLAGLGIVVSGLRGRTSGALGWIAVLGILVLVPATLAQQTRWDWYGTNVAVGDIDQTPTTIEEAERGYSIGAGEIRVDLTELDLSDRRNPVEVPISAGAGDVTVLVPEDAALVADVTLNAGRLEFFTTNVVGQVHFGEAERYESPAVEAGEDPVLHLVLTVGAGDVTVREER